MEKHFIVYIMINTWHTVLYTGMSGRGLERVGEHRAQRIEGFTKRYHIHKLVYLDSFDTPGEAAEAEYRIKKWSRQKKIALIESTNPDWNDLWPEKKLSVTTN